MKLEDIPKIRKQMRTFRNRYKAAWKDCDPRNEESYGKWHDAYCEIRKDEMPLLEKYFGHDLDVDGQQLDADVVLDWIEHFMQVDA